MGRLAVTRGKLSASTGQQSWSELIEADAIVELMSDGTFIVIKSRSTGSVPGEFLSREQAFALLERYIDRV